MLQSWTFVMEDGNISYNTEAETNTINGSSGFLRLQEFLFNPWA